MNQKEMATLLNKNFKTISYYIKKMNDYISNNPSVVRNFETTATEGKTYEMSYFYRCYKKLNICQKGETATCKEILQVQMI